MSQAIEKIRRGTLRIEISQDEDASSPREDDNVGTMVCFHKRYELGDKNHGYKFDDYDGWEGLKAAIAEREGPIALILPLRLYDHSGISMSVGSGAHPMDHGGWDSGTVGLIYITEAKASKEFGDDRSTLEACLTGEVETYSSFLTGEIYEYTIEDAEGEFLESLCGMYGLDYCRTEAIEAADGILAKLAATAAVVENVLMHACYC